MRKLTVFILICLIATCALPTTSEADANSQKAAGQIKQEKPIETVRWVDEETGQELFNIYDIVRFDWDKQIFELSQQGAMNLLSRRTRQYRKFTVRSGTNTIYSGTFVSAISSMGFSGPVIVFDGEVLSGVKPPLFKIDNGYPERTAKSGGDMRFSEHLKKVLEQTKVLGEIDLNKPPSPIERITYGWFREDNGLKVLVEVFPETFRLGQLTRIHLRLADAKYLNEPNHIVEVNSIFISNEGKFKYSTKRIFPAHRDGEEVYIMGMTPWGPVEGSAENRAKAGPAQINMEIFTRKVLDEKTNLYSAPIDHIKIEPIKVTILPFKKWVELTDEAKAVMAGFQEALKSSDWEKALSLCSENVKAKAKEYPSADTFFKDVVPAKEVADISEFNIWGADNNKSGYTGFKCFLQLSEPNAEPTINWLCDLNKTDTGWIIDFNTTPLKLQIEQRKIQNNRSHLEWKDREKKLKEGFKVSLIPLGENFVIGKPILFRVEMKNISNENLEVGYMSNAVMVNDPMLIKDSNGRIVPYMDTSYQTAGVSKSFEPGEMVVLADNYDASSQYHIIKPGRYTFQFKGQPGFTDFNSSNIVEIDIAPGEMSPLEDIVEKLKPIVPEGWGLTRRIGEAEPNSSGDTAPTIWVHLIGRHGSKGSRTERSTSLFIIINPTQSFWEKRGFEAEYWGESVWGPVYVKNLNAELLWPNYKEQIINALNLQTSK